MQKVGMEVVGGSHWAATAETVAVRVAAAAAAERVTAATAEGLVGLVAPLVAAATVVMVEGPEVCMPGGRAGARYALSTWKAQGPLCKRRLARHRQLSPAGGIESRQQGART